MIKTLSFIIRLRNTYRANSFIFALRSLPFAKKVLPVTLYKNRFIKNFANVLAAIIEFFSIFLGKLVYLGATLLVMELLYNEFGVNIDFAHLFVFLTVAGAISNNRFDNATRDSYYAIFLMRLPAREYALTEMSYFLTKSAIGFLLFSIVAGLFAELSIYEIIAIPFLVVSLKIIFIPLLMFYSHRNSKAMGRSYSQLLVSLLLAILGLVAGAFDVTLPYISPLMLAIPFSIAAIFVLKYIFSYPDFKEFYRKLFVTDIVFIKDSSKAKKDLLSDSYAKQITNSNGITSSKKGFAYFNDLFVKRHRKILSRSALITAVILMLIAVSIGAYSLVNSNFAAGVNSFLLTNLSFSLFVMYIINCGNRVTHAMFANCDGSMLRYGFYRLPSSLLTNFAHRLISLIKINLIPCSVIALALPILLFISGGTNNNTDYILIVISILSISIFFSVHSMVLYYLLQPYNQNMDQKNPMFTIVNSITYVICYVTLSREIPLVTFCISTTAFCVFYIILSLVLVYILAPKTFKLRG